MGIKQTCPFCNIYNIIRSYNSLNLSSIFLFRYKEKGNIEAHFFSIQTNLKAQGIRYYVPPEGKMVSDIERAWVFLEKAEHDRELALREEMIR